MNIMITIINKIMDKEKIIDYLDKQFWKHKTYECMPENEHGYEFIPRESLSKIVDGLIPMLKKELKKSIKKSLLLDYKKWIKNHPEYDKISEEEKINLFINNSNINY